MRYGINNLYGQIAKWERPKICYIRNAKIPHTLKLDIEAERNHVAVAHGIIFAFNPQLAGFARLGEGTVRDQIVVMNCFRGDEAALKIGMDYTCRSRCFVALMNCPSARFLFAG